MTWEMFYFLCFIVGLTLSLCSVVTGHAHLPLPHGWWHHGSLGHVTSGHPSGAGHAAPMSPINALTCTAFLTWFGGAGYLLTRYSHLWILVIVGLTVISGLTGAALVFGFITWLLSYEQPLDPAAYVRVGKVGRVTNPIRPGGTGEIVFSSAGIRQVCAARSEDGTAIPQGTEVIITQYERGIASVVRFDLACERSGHGSALGLDRLDGGRGAEPHGDPGPTVP